jgi:hypothetical protein
MLLYDTDEQACISTWQKLVEVGSSDADEDPLQRHYVDKSPFQLDE